MNEVKALNKGKAIREIKAADRAKVMNQDSRALRRKIAIMSALVLAAAVLYMAVDVNFANEKLFAYSMRIRTPKLIVMLITAFAIGGASIVFQSIINNTIVTPCLLGMNSLYTLIHTAVVFFAGSGSILAVNANLSFGVDLVLMGIVATVIYSYMFKKTKHNVLYVLLIGTVLTSFFSSIQTTLTRVMDPNEYDNLLSTLVASFSNINSEIIIFSLIVLAVVMFVLRKDLALLDVITLGKNQAINLGVDYDRTIRRLLLGGDAFYCCCHSHGRAHLLFRIDHCQPGPAADENLPPWTAGHCFNPVWNDRAGRGTDHCGACVCVFCSGKCVYYCRRRNLFPLSAADKQEGLKNDCRKSL